MKMLPFTERPCTFPPTRANVALPFTVLNWIGPCTSLTAILPLTVVMVTAVAGGTKISGLADQVSPPCFDGPVTTTFPLEVSTTTWLASTSARKSLPAAVRTLARTRIPGPSQVCTETLPFTESTMMLSAGGNVTSRNWQNETRPLTTRPGGLQLSFESGGWPRRVGDTTARQRMDKAIALYFIFISML